MPEYDSSPTNNTAQPVTRPRQACIRCRQAKMRCLPLDNEEPDSKAACKRCHKQGHTCDYSRKKAGRPSLESQGMHPTKRRRLAESTVPSTSEDGHDTPVGEHTGPIQPIIPEVVFPAIAPNQSSSNHSESPLTASPLQYNPSRATRSLATNGSSSTPVSQSGIPFSPFAAVFARVSTDEASNQQLLPWVQPMTTSSTVNSRPRPLDMTLVAERMSTEDVPTATTITTDRSSLSSWARGQLTPFALLQANGQWESTSHESMLNPIQLGLISELEAQSMVNYFIQHVGSLVALFDPAYHTFQRIKQSPCLLSAALYAASRYLAPNHTDKLHKHCDFLIYRCLTEGFVDVTVIQAILVLSWWQKATDQSLYMRTGMAIRAGYQLGLNKVREGELPDDEVLAREVLDRERTWIFLSSSDRGITHLLRLPSMIQDRSDPVTVGQWTKQHSQMNIPGDWFLYFNSEFRFNEISDIAGGVSSEEDQAALGWKLATTERDINRTLEAWMNSGKLIGNYRQLCRILGLLSLLKVQSKQFHYAPSGLTRSRLLMGAEELVDQLVMALKAGWWGLLPDTTSVGAILPGILVYVARESFSVSELTTASRMMSEMINTCDAQLERAHLHVLSYISSFYHRLEKSFQELLIKKQELVVANELATISGNGYPEQPPMSFLCPPLLDDENFLQDDSLWPLIWGQLWPGDSV